MMAEVYHCSVGENCINQERNDELTNDAINDVNGHSGLKEETGLVT